MPAIVNVERKTPEELAAEGLELSKVSGSLPLEEAQRLVDKFWTGISNSDRKRLAVRGLSQMICDLYKDDRRKSVPDVGDAGLTARQADLLNEVNAYLGGLGSLPTAEDVRARNERDERVKKAAYKLRKQEDECRKRAMSFHAYVYGKRSKADLNGVRTKELFLDLESNGLEWCDLVLMDEGEWNARRDGVRAAILAARDERLYWHRLHDRMRCQNVSCREGRYNHSDSRYGQCAYKYLNHYPPEERERRADEFGSHWVEYEKMRDEMMGFLKSHYSEIGYKEALADLRSISLASRDGVMKSLYEFTSADLDHWVSVSDSQAKAWETRRAWFDSAVNMLTERGVNSVADLPAEDVRKLGGMAREVWKSSDEERVDKTV